MVRGSIAAAPSSVPGLSYVPLRLSEAKRGEQAGADEARAPKHDQWALRTGIPYLLLSSLYCVGLEWARVEYTGHRTYLFLIWNLFLAWIPLAVALLIERVRGRGGGLVILAPLAAIWLLFFPNAPYIVTDFVHLRPRASAPLWFDVLLIASFAWTGLLLGFVSLNRVQRLVTSEAGALAGWLLAAGVLTLASFGIYIGRFEVRNSWDVIVQPVHLARDTWHELTSPAIYPRALGVTACYAIFLILAYAASGVFGGGLRFAEEPHARSRAGDPSHPGKGRGPNASGSASG